jgi:hypothetical protein
MNFKNVMSLPLLAILVGCSTVPIPIPRTSGPSIVIVRDTGLSGGACTFDVLVDGELASQLEAGKTFTKMVSNGKHRVSIENATAVCPNVKMSKVVVVDGEPVVLRVGVTSNFQVLFDQVE